MAGFLKFLQISQICEKPLLWIINILIKLIIQLKLASIVIQWFLTLRQGLILSFGYCQHGVLRVDLVWVSSVFDGVRSPTPTPTPQKMSRW